MTRNGSRWIGNPGRSSHRPTSGGINTSTSAMDQPVIWLFGGGAENLACHGSFNRISALARARARSSTRRRTLGSADCLTRSAQTGGLATESRRFPKLTRSLLELISIYPTSCCEGGAHLDCYTHARP